EPGTERGGQSPATVPTAQAVGEKPQVPVSPSPSPSPMETREEIARREKEAAEAFTRRRQDLYNRALQLAKDALDESDFEKAITWYTQAAKVLATDEARRGVSLAEAGRARLRAADE